MTRRSTLFWAWLGWLGFVVYGSLVPLDYTALPWDQAVATFRNIPFLQLGIDSRADWVANGVLFAPLGFLSAQVLKAWLPRLPYAMAIPLAFAGCAALAGGVEFTQLFFPPRTVSQNDLMAEAIGSAVGALLAPVLAGWLARLGAGWFAGGGKLLWHLLEGYAVVYVLLCFFPYDLLLSAAEVQRKWASGLWGWALAPHERGLLFALLPAARQGLWWLLSVDEPQTTFVLADPFVGHAGYGIDLGESEREALQIVEPTDALALVMVSLLSVAHALSPFSTPELLCSVICTSKSWSDPSSPAGTSSFREPLWTPCVWTSHFGFSPRGPTLSVIDPPRLGPFAEQSAVTTSCFNGCGDESR